jgi:hypothetical protein
MARAVGMVHVLLELTNYGMNSVPVTYDLNSASVTCRPVLDMIKKKAMVSSLHMPDEIPRGRVEIGTVLGEGAFGEVVSGTIKVNLVIEIGLSPLVHYSNFLTGHPLGTVCGTHFSFFDVTSNRRSHAFDCQH